MKKRKFSLNKLLSRDEGLLPGENLQILISKQLVSARNLLCRFRLALNRISSPSIFEGYCIDLPSHWTWRDVWRHVLRRS